jgi:hypothetical protein
VRDISAVADRKELTYEPVQEPLRWPERPENMSDEELIRWSNNVEVIHNWDAKQRPGWDRWNAPKPETLAKYMRTIVAFYNGGRIAEVSGLLKDIEEGK